MKWNEFDLKVHETRRLMGLEIHQDGVNEKIWFLKVTMRSDLCKITANIIHLMIQLVEILETT